MGSVVTVQELDPASRAAQRYAAGDEKALEEALRLSVNAAYSQAVAMLGDPGEAEDAVQDAFLGLLRDVADYDGRHSFGAWVARRVRLACLMRLRARRTRRRHERQAALQQPISEPTEIELAESPAAPDETSRHLSAALAELPASLRGAVELHYFTGLGVADIAHVLETNPNTVKTWLARGRDRLRQSLLSRGVGIGVTAVLLALTESHAKEAPASLQQAVVPATLQASSATAALVGTGAIGTWATAAVIILTVAVSVTLAAMLVSGASGPSFAATGAPAVAKANDIGANYRLVAFPPDKNGDYLAPVAINELEQVALNSGAGRAWRFDRQQDGGVLVDLHAAIDQDAARSFTSCIDAKGTCGGYWLSRRSKEIRPCYWTAAGKFVDLGEFFGAGKVTAIDASGRIFGTDMDGLGFIFDPASGDSRRLRSPAGEPAWVERLGSAGHWLVTIKQDHLGNERRVFVLTNEADFAAARWRVLAVNDFPLKDAWTWKWEGLDGAGRALAVGIWTGSEPRAERLVHFAPEGGSRDLPGVQAYGSLSAGCNERGDIVFSWHSNSALCRWLPVGQTQPVPVPTIADWQPLDISVINAHGAMAGQFRHRDGRSQSGVLLPSAAVSKLSSLTSTNMAW